MLELGTTAPPFSLPGDDGDVSLADLTEDMPALLAFFKTTCGTCKLGFPVYGELARRHGHAVNMMAISQDDLSRSREFLDQHGWDAAVIEDESSGYATSAAYDLPGVPTLYLVGRSGTIDHAASAWDRAAANELDRVLATISGATPSPVSTDDGRPDFKPG
jgi:peroxiredoxin